MIKLLAALALSAAIAAPALQAAAQPNGKAVEKALLEQVNSGPAGKMTRVVHCTPTGHGTLACTLESVRGTTLNARVTTRDGVLHAAWSPLHG
jgi:hypothetical protein